MVYTGLERRKVGCFQKSYQVETLATHATPSVSIGRIRIYAMHAMRLDIIILLYWPLITPTGTFMQFYEQINMWSCIWYMVAYSVKAVLNK